MTQSAAGVSADLISVAVRSIRAMAHGERAEFDGLYHPEATDRENRIQPPSSRVPGADCFWSTAQWLRAAFPDLHYDIHHAVTDGELVVVNSTMNGTHEHPWVMYDDDAQVDTVFAPTHKPFAMTQSHWLRMRDGLVLEHWANRDDMGTALQLGWLPPTPVYLVRMALAKRKAKREARRAARTSSTVE